MISHIPVKTQSTSTIESPLHLRKGTASYYKYKYELLKEKVETLEKSPYEPKDIPSVFSYNKVKPKKSKNMRITSVHGSMTAKNILNVVKENNNKIEEKEIKSEKKEKKGKRSRVIF